MRVNPVAALRPRNTPKPSGKTIVIPFHGGATNQTINSITYEKQCVVTLAGPHAATAGGWANITGVTSLTAINGVWRIVRIESSTKLRIDLDTSGMSGFATGGTFARNGIGDLCGSMLPKKVNGTTTAIWDDRFNGIHWAGDNYITVPAAEAAVFDLRGFRGRLLIHCALPMVTATAPSASEFLICLGRFDTASGAGRAGGTIGLFQTTSTGRMRLNVRGSVATDADTPSNPGTAAESNGAVQGDGTNPVRNYLGVELIFGASAVTINWYINGAIDSSSQLAMTGNDWPYPLDTAGGLTIGCKYGTTGITVGNAMGAAGSGARTEWLVIHRSEYGAMNSADVGRFFADSAAAGGSPNYDLLF